MDEEKEIHRKEFEGEINKIYKENEVLKRSVLLLEPDYNVLMNEVKEAQQLRRDGKSLMTLHYRRLKRYDILINERGEEVLIAKKKEGDDEDGVKYFVHYGQLFEILHTTHIELRHKKESYMDYELKKKYANITRLVINAYLKHCQTCRFKKLIPNNESVVKPVISKHLDSKGQTVVTEWSETDVLKLIEMYRSREFLWNLKHPQHFNRSKKNVAWKEIAFEFHSTVYECKRKMLSLQSSLRREKCKLKKCAKTGKGLDENYESSWFAFNSFAFLWDKDKAQETMGEDEDSDEQESVNFSSSESDSLQDRISCPSPELKTLQVNNEPNRKSYELIEATIKRKQEEEELEMFGRLIAAKLKKYSSDTKSSVQQEILTIMFNADHGCYEQGIQPNFTEYSTASADSKVNLDLSSFVQE